jgi:hypothetical protein
VQEKQPFIIRHAAAPISKTASLLFRASIQLILDIMAAGSMKKKLRESLKPSQPTFKFCGYGLVSRLDLMHSWPAETFSERFGRRVILAASLRKTADGKSRVQLR